MAVQTLIKIFENVEISSHLAAEGPLGIYNPSKLLSSLVNCKIDDEADLIDKQELILTQI